MRASEIAHQLLAGSERLGFFRDFIIVQAERVHACDRVRALSS